MTDKITRAFLKNIRDEINAALAPLAEKHGVAFHAGNASFQDHKATFKLEVMVGGVEDAAKRDWDSCCSLYGFKPEDFGRTFWSGSDQFTICGIKPRSRKYPILGKSKRGAVYKFARYSVNLT